MRPLAILILSDGKPGHYHLADGVAAAIGRRRPVAVTRLDVKPRRLLPRSITAGLLLHGVSPALALQAGYGIARSSLPPADLVISAGGDTLVGNVASARLLGVPNIFCGTLRRLPPEAVAVVVSSYVRHAGLPRHLVALKPNGMDPDALAANRTAYDPATGPPRVAGLLIGGDSGFFRYTHSEWRSLIEFLDASRNRHGTRWIVSTSRRSPGPVADALAAVAARPESPLAELIDFRTSGPGTLPGVLSRAEAVLCTEDSSTMLSEAVCARLPVVGVAPAHHNFKDEEREYRAFLAQSGWCRFLPLAGLTPERFVAALSEVRPLRENHLDRLAAELAERLPQIFA
jgi:hypothetical protein